MSEDSSTTPVGSEPDYSAYWASWEQLPLWATSVVQRQIAEKDELEAPVPVECSSGCRERKVTPKQVDRSVVDRSVSHLPIVEPTAVLVEDFVRSEQLQTHYSSFFFSIDRTFSRPSLYKARV